MKAANGQSLVMSVVINACIADQRWWMVAFTPALRLFQRDRYHATNWRQLIKESGPDN